MRKLALVLPILILFFSCNNNSKLESDDKFVQNPKTLEELFSGFSPNELAPDIHHLNKDSVVIIATGHLYPLIKFPEQRRLFLKAVKDQHPDYFFALGDLVFNNSESEWDTVISGFNSLNVPVYYAPGNHDLNYHYERYAGKHDHQVEAEMRYLRRAKCRYKFMKDDFANYVFINANDSVKRVREYINLVRPQFDKNKKNILLSSQSLWINKQQDPKKLNTWVNRPFYRDELLDSISDFQYLIHGDWAGKYFRSHFRKFDVMAVGNRRAGEKLYITRITITKDTVIGRPVFVPMTQKWLDSYTKPKLKVNQ